VGWQMAFWHMIRTSADYDMLSELFPLSNSCVGRKPRNLVHPQITAKIGYDLLMGLLYQKNCLVVGAVNYVYNYADPSNVIILV
jgi:hypothetical protein